MSNSELSGLLAHAVPLWQVVIIAFVSAIIGIVTFQVLQYWDERRKRPQ